MAVRVAGPHAVHEREPVGERDRQGGERGGDARPAGATGSTADGHGHIGQRAPARLSSGSPRAAVHSRGAPEGPHAVLGVEPGARPDEIKAAWRAPRPPAPPRPDRRRPGGRAARHAPDGRDQRGLRGADPGRRDHQGRRRGTDGDGATGTATRARPAPGPADGRPAAREAHPAGHRSRRHERHRASPRNQTTTPPGSRMPLTGQPPLRPDRSDAGPPRLAAVRAAGARLARRPRPARAAAARRGARGRAGLRQVPRPHAGRDRGVRAVATSTGWPGR